MPFLLGCARKVTHATQTAVLEPVVTELKDTGFSNHEVCAIPAIKMKAVYSIMIGLTEEGLNACCDGGCA